MVKINWTDQTIAVLTNIAEFIRKDSEKYARLTVKNISERGRQLKQYTTNGKIVTEIEKNRNKRIDFRQLHNYIQNIFHAPN